MNAVKIAITGFAAGAAVMYLTDPDRGRRRRALARDKSVKTWNNLGRLLDKARRDASNRAGGMFSMAQARFRTRTNDDRIVVERVRSRLGRIVSHPHAIEVSCNHGGITLKGLVLENELQHLLNCVRAIPGVIDIENRLEAHASPEHISSLQGGVPRESRSEFTQQNWTPALRVAAGALGSALIYRAMRSKGIMSAAGGFAGAALCARAVCNREFSEIVGIGNGARVIEIDKGICVHAPVEEVFHFWSDLKKLPYFMTHLKEVCDLGGGKSHWVAEGPGGIPVSWDAEITESILNKLLAWRSVPGSTVESEGVVRFESDGNSGTRVGIRMFYKPPAGVLGHYVASLLGIDPKSELDDDLVRLKSLLERGKTRAHGVKVSREALA